MALMIAVFKTILNIIYAVIKLCPTREKVTFISRQSDVKSLDMELLEQEIKRQNDNVEIVFLCRMIRPGLLQKIRYGFHMLVQMYHAATSRVVILDTYCIIISLLKHKEALHVIQIWHAMGALKKFGYSVIGKEEGSSRQIASLMKMHRNYDCIISSSRACAPHFAEAFHYPAEAVRVMSLPRVDLLTDETYRKRTAERIFQHYPELKEKENIVYAPTFRKAGKTEDDSFLKLTDAMDHERFNLIIKSHPLEASNIKDARVVVDRRFSTMEMFAIADYVILDYSAIVYEAAVMGKPMFFFAYDLDEYKGTRDFYVDYEAEMPGIVSKDAGAIMRAIETRDYDPDQIKRFADRFVEKQKDCTKEMVEYILRTFIKVDYNIEK